MEKEKCQGMATLLPTAGAGRHMRGIGFPCRCIMDNLGYLAAFLTTFAFIPQAIKTIRTRDTSGLSLAMYACLTVGIFFWLLHGINKQDYALIGANGVTLLLAFPIFLIILTNERAARRALKGKLAADK
ncbi:MAG: SemiSWEET transporter [Parvibaculum sp.]|nr:SemiSWEET transporter [Parvibaculum sp.]